MAWDECLCFALRHFTLWAPAFAGIAHDPLWAMPEDEGAHAIGRASGLLGALSSSSFGLSAGQGASSGVLCSPRVASLLGSETSSPTVRHPFDYVGSRTTRSPATLRANGKVRPGRYRRALQNGRALRLFQFHSYPLTPHGSQGGAYFIPTTTAAVEPMVPQPFSGR